MDYPLVLILLAGFLLSGHVSESSNFATFKTTSRDSLSSKALLDLSDEYTFSNPEKAKGYAQKALIIAKKEDDKSAEIRSSYRLGEINIRLGDLEEAKPYLNDGLKISRTINKRTFIARGLFDLSKYYEGEFDFTNALDYLNQSSSIYKQLGMNMNMADCYTSYGRIYGELGSYDKALDYYFKSLKINEKSGNKRGISVVKKNIGMVYLDNLQYNDALTFFSQALQINQSENDQEGIVITTMDIGVVHQKTGNYEVALDKYRKALILAKQISDKIDIALLLGNIGSTLEQQGKYEEGLPYLFSSLAARTRIHYYTDHVLNDISDTYMALHNFSEAKKYAEMAVDSSKKTKDLDQLRYAYLVLARANEKMGDFKDAYEALTQSDIAKDSLTGIQKNRQMQKLQVIYNTEQKEQTIKLLTLQQERASFRRNTYLISAMLVIAFLVLLYNRQRLKSRKNSELLQKEHEVAAMKSNFFDNISHEFRTPLTLILGPLQLLQADTENPKVKKQLGIMDRNVKRLLSLINQLLDLSKLDWGKITLTRSWFDIVQVVKGVTMTFQSLAEMKKIELLLESESDYLDVYCDQEKVETILTNLLTNAFHFTPDQGRIKVTLHISAGNPNDNTYILTVIDNGTGIQKKDISMVFDRFHQSVNSRDGHYDGTGIGLALTKELVELHKGSISVFSKEGEGTEFTVTLPVGDRYMSDPTGPDVPQPEIVELTTPISQTDHRDEELTTSLSHPGDAPLVLLIEDNEDVMIYLKDILGETYRLLEERDGETGVITAIETIPDLVISDVMMPKKNGYEVCDTLKRDERTSHIPIILLTARASLDDKMHGLNTRADEYLTKPFVPRELLIRIQNLIESRRQLMEKYKRKFIIKPDEISVNSIDEAFLLRVGKVVEQHLDDEQFSVEQLCREVGMSRSHIHRKLVALTDQSATEFIRSFRLHRAKEMIGQKAGSISEISYAVGFGSPSYFSKCFRLEFGITPSEVKDQPHNNQ
ncbi:MAG TPA: tetratricopeptide repeat protein [Balneolales bacterium]|nr:tetratricopeptide repeat protein [Balneolales bacterium]